MSSQRISLVACLAGVVLFTATAPARADTAQQLFTDFAQTPGGQVPVLVWWSNCELAGWDSCLERLDAWARVRRLHPLTKAALDYARAQTLRVLSRREEAQKLVASLGMLEVWTMAGAPAQIVMAGDPISGVVTSQDHLELLPGAAKEVVAVLRTERGGKVALRLATSGLERVCLDAQCVQAGDVQRPVFDSVAIPLALKKGANRLVLAFSPEGSSISFQARLTAPNGARLPAVTHKSDGDYTVRLPAKSAAALSSAQAWLETAVEEGGKRSRRASILACALAHAAGARGWEEWTGRVLEAKPEKLDEALYAHACLAGSDASYTSARYLLTRFPDEPRAWLAMAEYRCHANQKWRCWLALGRACPAGFEACFAGVDRVRTALLLQDVWSGAGMIDTTRTLLKQVLASDRSSAMAVALGETLSEQERLEEAAQILRGYLDRFPGDSKAAALQMYLLEKVGRLEELASLVEKQVWLYPTYRYFTQLLAILYERAGKGERAHELFQALEVWGTHNPLLLADVAAFHFRQGRVDQAVAVWERVVELRPNDVSIRDMLDRVKGVASSSPAGPSNEEVLALSDEIPDPESHGMVGVMDHTTVTLFGNGASRSVRCKAMRLVNPAESRSYTVEFSYDSHLEEVQVIKAVVLRPDGTVAPATDHGERLMSEEEYNLYYDQRSVFIRYEQLEPGDVLVAVYEIQRSPSALGAPFAGVHWLQGGYPRHNTRLDLEVAAGVELHTYLSKGVSRFQFEQEQDEGDQTVRHGFVIKYVPPAEQEPFPPGRFDRLAYIHYSTMEDWKQFATWYARLAYPLIQLDDDMKASVNKMVAAGGDRRAVVERLCRFVSDEIRYVGLELGVHGLKPYSPVDVFHRGFGDCKDKSLLLVSLLKQAGIEARMVVLATSSMGRPHVTPGSHALFDHAICYVPEEDLFLDPTARYLTLDHLPWQDQGAQAIIIEEDKPRQVALPQSSSEDNRVEFTANVTGGQGFHIEGSMRFTGLFARRVYYHLENRASWNNTVESYASSVLPVVSVEHVQEEVHTGSRPMLEVHFKGRWNPGSKGRIALLKELETNSSVVSSPSRELPLMFAYPYRQEYRVRFELGTVSVTRSPDASGDSEAAAFSVSGQNDEKGAVVRVAFEQKTGQVEVEDYGTYRQTVLKYADALSGLEVDLGD